MNIYVVIEGEQRGPLSSGEVRELLESGKLKPDDPALLEGEKQWSTVDRLARLPAKGAVASEPRGAGVQPMASMSRDFKNIKRNSASTADELRGFMREMRGKSPAEMLGAIAQSTLIRSLVIATASLAVLMLVLTVAPFLMAEKPDPKVAGPPKPDSPAETKLNPAKVKPEIKPLDVLGVGQEKKGKPKEVNPFENKEDPLGEIKID
jgi:hypothetical protein